MSIYKRLGIRTVINGNATLTRLGGSIMPPEVVAAMADAAKHFVDIIELQKRVGEEIAKLTHNEAAYVSCGAAAALTLSTAACITGLDPDTREKLPHLDPSMKSEVIVHRHGRVGYDFAVRQVGVTFVEIGDENGTTSDELENAITEKTAAIFYFANPTREHLWVPYEEAIAIAKRHNVPLIVDAAAQLPPPENLWRFTQMGADLALFSGGKGLCGPQSSGLIVGKESLIEAIAFNGPPHPFIGRGMKVEKKNWSVYSLLLSGTWIRTTTNYSNPTRIRLPTTTKCSQISKALQSIVSFPPKPDNPCLAPKFGLMRNNSASHGTKSFSNSQKVNPLLTFQDQRKTVSSSMDKR